jgi:hypothetical protein
MKKSQFISFSLYIIGGLIVLGVVAIAGSLSPLSSPAPTTRTLNDVYQKLTNNSYSASIADSFNFPTGEATSTMATVEQIYNLIPTIYPSTIISGQTILGVSGSYDVSNLLSQNVASGTTFGVNSVGTAVVGGNPLFVRPSLKWSLDLGQQTYASSTIICSSYNGDGQTPSFTNVFDLIWRLPTASELTYAIEQDQVLPVNYWDSRSDFDSKSIKYAPHDLSSGSFAFISFYWTSQDSSSAGTSATVMKRACDVDTCDPEADDAVTHTSKAKIATTNLPRLRCVK